jgi:hypothetical protein
MAGYSFTPKEAGHVLNVMASEGMAPGSFIESLIVAISKADPNNRRLLALGFPGYVDAVTAYQTELGGISKLREAFLIMAEGGTG